MSSEVVAGVCACAVIILAKEIRKKIKKTMVAKTTISWYEGHAKNLLNDFKLEDGQGFRNFLRMTPPDFELLLNMIKGLKYHRKIQISGSQFLQKLD